MSNPPLAQLFPRCSPRYTSRPTPLRPAHSASRSNNPLSVQLLSVLHHLSYRRSCRNRNPASKLIFTKPQNKSSSQKPSQSANPAVPTSSAQVRRLGASSCISLASDVVRRVGKIPSSLPSQERSPPPSIPSPFQPQRLSFTPPCRVLLPKLPGNLYLSGNTDFWPS